VLFSEPEKAAFNELVALGLCDSFRLFDQPEKSFTWWDYRTNGFKRGLGLRIDHILLSDELAKYCRSCAIERDRRAYDRPSDHAPVMVEIEI
jgi:exodeoxyribonuclease-3